MRTVSLAYVLGPWASQRRLMLPVVVGRLSASSVVLVLLAGQAATARHARRIHPPWADREQPPDPRRRDAGP